MARRTGRIKEGRELLTQHHDPIITRQIFKAAFPKYTGAQLGNLVNSLIIAKDISTTNKKGVYVLGKQYRDKMEDKPLHGDLTASQVGTSIIAFIDILKDNIRQQNEAIDKWRANVKDLQSTIRGLRSKLAECADENAILRKTVKDQSGKTLSMEEVATVITRKGAMNV